MNRKLLYLLLILLSLPLVIIVSEQVQRLLSKAAPQPANIIIDTQNPVGPIPLGWNSHAQGGEEPPPMLKAVAPKLKEISPKYIRLDHIYDYYDIVKRKDSGFEYDFSRLDETVNDIIASGAIPFFSLSYMPNVFTSSGKVIDIPSNWNWWKDLVKATVERYSGKSGQNLTGVYYEVWNEPELPQFGSWKIGSDKDYRLLYFHAATGASEAKGANNFFFGGPAVGSYYPNWVNGFLSYVVQNNLRLDFYSWHRYHKRPAMFNQDAQNIRKNLAAFPKFAKIPLVLSEWGIDSENTPINNSESAAAFAVSAITQFINDIDLAFAFEVKDGPPPGGGHWGLFTHEKSTPPLSPKPRFFAYSALNKLSGQKLSLSGSGTYVSGLASKNDQKITVVLGNYDLNGKNTENVPVTFTGLPPSSYKINYSYPLSQTTGSFELIATNGNLTKEFPLSANNILVLELEVNAPLASFVPGRNNVISDQALVLADNAPFILSAPEFRLRPSGNISFDIKPFWQSQENKTFLIFDAPYATTSAIINRLFLAKEKKDTGDFLTFGVGGNNLTDRISIPIDNWTGETWHHLMASWDINGLSLTADNQPAAKLQTPIDVRNGILLRFYPVNAAIDNLKIILGEEQIITRNFNSRVDK